MLFKVSTVKMVKLFCTHLLYIIKFQTIVLILQTFVLHLTTKNLINLKFMLLILVHWRGIHKTQPTHLLLKMSNLERTNFIKNTNPLMIRDTLKKLCLLTYLLVVSSPFSTHSGLLLDFKSYHMPPQHHQHKNKTVLNT